MSSSSPGYANEPEDPEDAMRATQGATTTPAPGVGSPARAPAQKRARGSPASPPRPSALAMLGNLTETVRASAVRRLRAITDSIERARDDASSTGSSASIPPSPTEAVRAVSATPDGKRRRTALTEARTRSSHADWRGAQWDYTSAMRDKNLFRVGETRPSVFAFPSDRPPAGDGSGGAQLVPDIAQTDATPSRPPSAMSAASAPAALSTPHSHARPHGSGDRSTDEPDDRGWVVAVARADLDPFAIPTSDPTPMDGIVTAAGDEDDEQRDQFVRAVRDATVLLTRDNVNSPEACGALLAFQARLRAFDPYGNFTSHSPEGGAVAAELRELRRAVDEIAAAQRESSETLRAVAERQSRAPPPSGARPSPAREGDVGRDAVQRPEPVATPPARAADAPRRPAAAAAAAATPPAPAPAPAGVVPRARATGQARAIGHHDERRAVFCPAVPFGGRLPAHASPDDVRRLNLSSYLVRDCVNGALRDKTIEQMDEATDPVQVTAVNWTERGNLCMITCEAFVAAELLLQADTAAEAAELGAGWKACRDVPVFKAVLRGAPTKRADGRLFTEDEILGDLRAHSSAFNSLALADAAAPASWISRDDERALRDHSTLVLNLATEADAARLLSMRRCLFAFGRACEPGPFQPRERERVCGRCWNPLARHRERDFACTVRCRLCGERHAEEDHTCHVCDVLAKACEHIPLKCVNCTQQHAADDGKCEYRRRMRGTSPSAPPMSTPGGTRGAKSPAPATPGQKKRKGKRVRILDPHEPFPEDAAPAPVPTSGTAPPHSPARAPPAASPPPEQGSIEPGGEPADKAARRKRATGRRKATSRARPAPEIPPPPQDWPPAGADDGTGSADPWASPALAGDASLELDDSDIAAMQDLVGGPTDARPAAATPPGTDSGHAEPPEPGTEAPARRTPHLRAAADADRDARRRRAAHVLRREFNFLKLSDAIAALRTCSDDHASAVSWAVEAQAERRKPGMQGKSAGTLQRLVTDMAAAAAKDSPRSGTDTPPPPAPVNA